VVDLSGVSAGSWGIFGFVVDSYAYRRWSGPNPLDGRGAGIGPVPDVR
jgi:hypothetical protein